MKTNRRKPFILATLALGLVLVMGLGANTFAKYVTTKNLPAKTAQVAKWGFTFTINADELFSDEYLDTAVVTTASGDSEVDVQGAVDVVAPGTTGSFTFTIAGTAEVDAALTVDAAFTDNVVLTVAEAATAGVTIAQDYAPIVWSLTKDGVAVPAAGTTAASIAAYIDTFAQDRIEAGDTATAAGEYEVTWTWEFEQNNEADTVLGQQALTDAKTVSVGLNMGVAQIQGVTP